MKIALVFSSKTGMAATTGSKRAEEKHEDKDELPVDFLAECDSDGTIHAIHEALSEKYDVFSIESNAEVFDRLRTAKPDLVFNIAERLVGPNRESHIPVICELLDIPYTGSDALTLGLCLDKSRTKEILSYHRIPTPPFWIAEDISEIPATVEFPSIVKPLYEGSSKGIRNNSVVRTKKDLKARVAEVTAIYKQPVIIEKFLSGREFTVGILGNHPDYEVLPIVEIDYSLLPQGATPIYSYEAKWVWDTPERPLKIFQCPARISKDLAACIGSLVREACKILRVNDWGRIDVRLNETGDPYILEINPLPGILPNPEENSCLPKAARTAGYTYSSLIHRVVDEALKRYGIKK